MDYTKILKSPFPRMEVTSTIFSGRGYKQIPRFVFDYPKLRKLDLSHNSITEIPEDIVSLKELRVIDLSYNNLTCIPSFVFSLPHLRTLAIGHNHIVSLPYGIATSSLRDLIADHNNIDFILPSTLTTLRKLILSNNCINIGFVTDVFPHLYYLDVRRNPSFQVAGRDKIPSIKRYYHDTVPGQALSPEWFQNYYI